MTGIIGENPHHFSTPQQKAEGQDTPIPKDSLSLSEKISRSITFSAPDELLEEIKFFQQALLDNDFLEIGSPQSSASFFTQSSTIYGLINRLKKLIENPYKDYNINPKIFNKQYRPVFDRLINSLENQITAVHEHKSFFDEDQDQQTFLDDKTNTKQVIYKKHGKYYTDVSEETKIATQLVLNKIYELKYDTTGLIKKLPLISDYALADTPPMLQILDNNLRLLHSQLIKYPPKEDLIEKFFKDVARSLTDPNQLIPHYSFDIKDQKIIERFMQKFNEYLSLPAILRKDGRFSPSHYDLNKEIMTLKNLISTKVDNYLSYFRKKINSGKSGFENSKTLIKNSFTSPLKYLYGLAESYSNQIAPVPLDQANEKPHPLLVFNEALKFFTQPHCFYNSKQQLLVLQELLSECDDSIKGFKNDLMNELVKFIPNQSKENQNIFQNLKQLQEKILPQVITEKTQNLPKDYSLESRLYYLTQQTEQLTTPQYYLNHILKIINNPSSELLKAPIRFMINSFSKFIIYSIDKIIDNVKAQDKKALEDLKKITALLFNNALATDTIDAYKNGILSFLKEYNKLQINLDCIELPEIYKDFSENKTTLENPQEIITSTLAKSKNLNYSIEENLEWEEEFQKQEKALSETATNYILFNLIYHTLLGNERTEDSNNLYFDIIARIKDAPTNEERIKAFLQEMKQAINKSPQNFFKKKFSTFVLSHFFYTLTHSRVDKFSKSILDFIRDNLNSIGGNPYEPINSKLIHQVDECAAQYQLMLEKWAKNGGNKQRCINKLIKEGSHNIGDKKSYTQEDLYQIVIKKASEIFVNGIDITEPLIQLSNKYQSWFVSKETSKHQEVSKIKSLALKTLKYLSYPVYISTYYTAYFILYLINKIINLFSYHLIEKTLEKTNSIEGLINGIQDTIYKKNPYVDIITDFLIDNLEDLDIALYKEDLDRRQAVINGDVPYKDVENAKISSKTKQAIQQALFNCFQLLEKNKHLTSDNLKNHLNTSHSTLAEMKNIINETLTDIINPKIIDSLIDVLVISSDVLFKKQHIDKQLSKFILQINNSLSKKAPSNETNLENLNQIYFQNELRLTKLMDKIIKKIVTLSINDEFDRFGDRYYKESENQKKWIQAKLLGNEKEDLGLIDHWSSLFEEIKHLIENKNSSNSLDIDDIKKQRELIKTVKQQMESFLAEFSIKLEAVETSSLSTRSVEKLYSQLLVLSKNLQILENDYILNSYTAIENMHGLISDQSSAMFLNTSYHNLKDHYQKLLNQTDVDTALDYLEKIDKTHTALQLTYQGLIENGITLENKEPLKLLITKYNSSDWNKKYMSVFNNIKNKLTIKKALDLILPEITHYSSLKKKKLEEHQTFFSKVRHYFDTTQKAYKTSYSKINNSLSILSHNLLEDINENYLKKINSATSVEEVELLMHNLKNHISNIDNNMTFERDLPEAEDILNSFEDHTKKFIKEIEQALDKHNEKLSSKLSDKSDHHIFNELNQLKNSVQNMQSIEHIHIPVGMTDFLKQQTASLVYSIVKPKADAAMDLVKDENFALFLINHLALIPIAESNK